jgi:hypothetical protein
VAWERLRLPPVQLDHLLRDLSRGERQLAPRIVALDDAEVRQGVEQGELVARDKASVGEEAPKLLQEMDLLGG